MKKKYLLVVFFVALSFVLSFYFLGNNVYAYNEKLSDNLNVLNQSLYVNESVVVDSTAYTEVYVNDELILSDMTLDTNGYYKVVNRTIIPGIDDEDDEIIDDIKEY